MLKALPSAAAPHGEHLRKGISSPAASVLPQEACAAQPLVTLYEGASLRFGACVVDVQSATIRFASWQVRRGGWWRAMSRGSELIKSKFWTPCACCPPCPLAQEADVQRSMLRALLLTVDPAEVRPPGLGQLFATHAASCQARRLGRCPLRRCSPPWLPAPAPLITQHLQVGFTHGNLAPETRKLLRALDPVGGAGAQKAALTHIKYQLAADPDEEGTKELLRAHTGGWGGHAGMQSKAREGMKPQSMSVMPSASLRCPLCRGHVDDAAGQAWGPASGVAAAGAARRRSAAGDSSGMAAREGCMGPEQKQPEDAVR